MSKSAPIAKSTDSETDDLDWRWLLVCGIWAITVVRLFYLVLPYLPTPDQGVP